MRALAGSQFCLHHDPKRKEEIKQHWLQARKNGSQRPYKQFTTTTMLRAMLIQYKLLLGWKAKTLLQECEKVSLLLELQKVIEKLRLQLALEKAGKKAQVSSETQS
jgi:hypothetical protein